MDLFGLYANWSGSSVSGIIDVMCAITSLSKHYMITDVFATKWWSLWHEAIEFFGNRKNVRDLKTWGL
jgi:hypothetical protein